MFYTYKKFYTIEELNAVAEILKANNIEYQFEYGTEATNNVIFGGIPEMRCLLKIDRLNYKKADEVILGSIKLI